MMTKRVHATLVSIKNVVTGDDPGANLEIYGDLHAMRATVNSTGEFQSVTDHSLFHVVSDDAIDISRGSVLTSISRTAPELVIEAEEFLWIGGHLAEHDDPGVDDNLGSIGKSFPHDAIQSGPQTIVYQESDQIVEVQFSLVVS
jgi:hypothetical protein